MNYKEQNQADMVDEVNKAIKARCASSGDGYSGIMDLLADMMMFCHVKNIDFQEALSKATFHFECEK